MRPLAEFLATLRRLDVHLHVEGQSLRCQAPRDALTPALKQELAARKAEIIELIGCEREPAIVPCPRTEPLPLSFAQQRLWFLHQFEPHGSAYNIPTAVSLEGALDVARLEHSLSEIVRRHEVLRTRFVSIDGQPRQVIEPAVSIPVPCIDLSARSRDEREQEVRQLTAEEAHRPFDLAQGPLIRACLLRSDDTEHVLSLTLHHIVADGWSTGILVKELTILYRAFTEGKPSPLPELPIQYADFACWQRQWLQGDVLNAQLAYWRAQLHGAPAVLELPAARPRPAQASGRGALHTFVLPSELTGALHAVCRAQQVTLFILLLAAFKVLLYRYSGQGELCVGTPIANRQRIEIEGLIGFFANTLVLRSDLSDNPPFTVLLARVRENVLEAQAHQDLPFEHLVEALNPVRDTSHTPLFQAMFVLQNTPLETLEVPGLRLSAMAAEGRTAKFDLTLTMTEGRDSLIGAFEYNTDLFAKGPVQRMVRHLSNLVEGIVADPEVRLGDLPLMNEAERHRLLIEWNATQATHPQAKLIHQLFEAQEERTPDAIAAIFEDQQLTYRELNMRANQLAHHLRARDAGPDVLIGVCMERSLELVVALLATLKAGGAFVPIDLEYPRGRRDFMVEDSAIGIILTHSHVRTAIKQSAAEIVAVDTEWDIVSGRPTDNPTVPLEPLNLAYVIYTSGSTGEPKGAANTHAGILNRLLWMQKSYPLNEGDSVLQKTPLSFDVSVWEFFWPLMTGVRLLVTRPGGHRDSRYLAHLIATKGVTTLHFVPSMLRVFLQEIKTTNCPTLKRVVCSGEALTRDLQQRFFERLHAELHNLYGPTEAAIDVTSWRCAPADTHREIPIGKPIDNTQLYVLDGQLNPVPIGIAGEIYIAGAGLARGYLKRPELTAERFIPHPFSAEPGARLYRTGDRARYRGDGNLEYLGRIDQQVKIRGHRIEPGEVESRLCAHAGVKEAVVISREDQPGDKRLVGYVVGAQGAELEPGILRAHLKESLPEYMVPSALVFLEALPLTPNGKLDRKALPAPDVGAEFKDQYVAPRNATEELLCGIWAEVLGVEQVGTHDNFFALGGHSLLATQVISRVRQRLASELKLRELFQTPTVAGLAEIIEAARVGDTAPKGPPLVAVPRTRDLPLSFAQQRLWFLDQLGPGRAVYNIPTAVRLEGRLDVAALEQSLNDLVRRHEVLRTRFGMVDGEPVQVIAPVLKLSLPIVDLSHLTVGERETEARRQAAVEAQRPFDLVQGPMLRVSLLQLGEQEQLLLFTLHHTVCDGWSMGILIREVAALYAAFSQNRPSPLPELPIQYADFAVWQREWLQGEMLASQTNYWKRQLAGAPTVLKLPADHPRPAVQRYRGAKVAFQLPQALTDQLNVLSRAEGVTLFMLLLTGWNVVLHHQTACEDLVVGTDVANRNQLETEGLIGFFVNQLALRTKLADNPSFRDLLAQVRDLTMGAYAHQDLPFEQVVGAVNPVRSRAFAPLFQIKLVLQNVPVSTLTLPNLRISPLEVERGTAELDLLLNLTETAQGVRGWFEYNTDLFDGATITRLAEQFVTVLRSVAVRQDYTLEALEALLAQAERQGQGEQQRQSVAASLQKLKTIKRKRVSARS